MRSAIRLNDRTDFDVIILGSATAGTMRAAIAARSRANLRFEVNDAEYKVMGLRERGIFATLFPPFRAARAAATV